MSTETKRLPADWSEELGIDVLDPDGWRADGQPWGLAITEEDFRRRAAMSTMREVATPAPLDPSADDALAASLQRLGKVWGEYRDQQVRGAAKALDVVAASIQQVVDAANAVHQPAPEPKPEWEPEAIVRATVNGVLDTLLMRLTPGYEGGFVWATPTLTPRRPENEQSWLLYEDADIADVRPLVVIDPAAVDVDALVEVAHHDRVLYGDTTPDQMRRAILRILAHMGIEATS